MDRKTLKRWGILLLCGLFLCASLGSVLLSAHHSDHQCDEEFCLLCSLVSGAKALLKALGLVLLFGGARLACELLAMPILKGACLFRRMATPIEMKVKMLN